MTAKCSKCNDSWNVSIKADLSKKYICPKCEAKEKRRLTQRTTQKKSIEKIPKVLLNNKSKFACI